jgi:alpha-glucoside transport system permease protein
VCYGFAVGFVVFSTKSKNHKTHPKNGKNQKGEKTMTTMDPEQQGSGFAKMVTTGPLRIVVSFIVPVITFLVLYWSFNFMRNTEAPKLLIAVVAIVVGVGGVWALFLTTDNLVSMLPEKTRELVRPFVFVGPGLVVLVVYLVYPAFYTLSISFFGPKSEEFVGLKNYFFAFTAEPMQIALRNNVMWMIFVTTMAVAFGLIIAVMVDRIGKWEPVAKSLIFLPMAISAVGSSVIWRFMYYAKPEGEEQIGLINAIIVGLGGEPVGFMIEKSLNNFALMFIMIWTLTGFCMIILSAAVKGVPDELLEAARLDGAGEIRIFFSVIIPYIKGTIITVATTVLIMVLKVFDIVYVMTNGRFDTEVVANRMFNEMFKFGDYGHASALVTILMLATIPIMIYNIRSLRAEKR